MVRRRRPVAGRRGGAGRRRKNRVLAARRGKSKVRFATAGTCEPPVTIASKQSEVLKHRLAAGEAAMTRTASCSCGQLRIRCDGEPAKVSLCHCLECQRRTGSTFGIAAFFDAAATEIAGMSSTYRRVSDNGFPVTLHFCGTCGSTVYWYPSRKPDAVAVAVGCFADPAFPAPSQSVYEEHRHGWTALPAPRSRFAGRSERLHDDQDHDSDHQ
jgi:hypothetical protein